MTANGPLHVLVIDDDADTRRNLTDILELDDYRVDTAASAAEALRRTDWSRYTAILLDRRLPDVSATELLPRLKKLAPQATILIVTGYADLHDAIAAMRQGAADYITKPINPEALRASLLRIAERRRLTLAKERSEAAFGALVQTAPCLIVIVRPDHRIVFFNQFAEELTGYCAAEVLGQDFGELFLPGEYRQPIHDNMARILAGTPIRDFEIRILCKDGSSRWVIWNAQKLPDYEGGMAILRVGQDITSLKQAQEQALQSVRLAAIGQMMTGLAHESGNALARSQACLDILAMEVEDRPEALDLIESIKKAQNHLQQMYEEVRGYATPLKLEREPWDMSAIWRQAWQNLALARQGKQAQLREHTQAVDLNCTVDHFRLEQVFRNILDNSLAACQPPVLIDITCSNAMLDGQPALAITIQDNGPGLTLEQQKRIFDPFFTTKTKGTGLGMAISQRIIEAHGGHITIGPNSSQGAQIILTVPRGSG